MKPWWERFPGLYDREIQSLDKRGIAHTRDDLAWRQGQLVLNLSVPRDGEPPIELVAYYPDHFPYTRFEVVAASLSLPRHQHPFGKNLCLMGRASANWSTEDTIGAVLEAQLPKLLRYRAENPQALRGLEEPQGEPVTDFFDYRSDTAVLIDSGWKPEPKARSGRLALRFSSPAPFRGAVTEILDDDGEELAASPTAFSRLYPKPVMGRWVRLDAPIMESNPAQLAAQLAARFPALAPTKLSVRKTLEAGDPYVIGVVFPEEVGHGTFADGWMFVVRTREGVHLARACRAGPSDMQTRSPELAPLPRKRVTAIGLGSVGGPSAIGLARHGLGLLKLVDFDFAEAGAGLRWPLGLSAAGRIKVEALAEHIAENYPYTVLEPHVGMIGRAQRPPAPHYCDWRDFDGLLDTDLLLDCTAEVGINLLLADAAAERGRPYIYASATEGGWGGLVFRQLPGREEACWSCLRHAMSDESVPTPPADARAARLQPVGCANPTFIGASVDLEQVSAMALRMALSTLCRGEAGGYPDAGWNVAVLALRSGEGELIAPTWTTLRVARHANCRNVSAHGDDLDTRKAA